jgi:hypothetical protein
MSTRVLISLTDYLFNDVQSSASSKQVRIEAAVAWASVGGVKVMLTAAKGAQLGRFVLGTANRFTTLEAVLLLLKRGAKVFLYRDSYNEAMIFHPKVYGFQFDQEHISYVGSSNLSLPGWVHSVEVNARIESADAGLVIDALLATTWTTPIADFAAAMAAKNSGQLSSENSRGYGSGSAAEPLAPIMNPRPGRHIDIDPDVENEAAELFATLQAAGFSLRDEVMETGLATFITDLGITEANRLPKIFSGAPDAGTPDINIGKKLAMGANREFWGWSERFNLELESPERTVPIRFFTHLTPEDGVASVGKWWVRGRDGKLTEFRLQIGTTDLWRTYCDASVGADSIVRVDRVLGGAFYVSIVRPGDAEYQLLKQRLRKTPGKHLAAYF